MTQMQTGKSFELKGQMMSATMTDTDLTLECEVAYISSSYQTPKNRESLNKLRECIKGFAQTFTRHPGIRVQHTAVSNKVCE